MKRHSIIDWSIIVVVAVSILLILHYGPKAGGQTTTPAAVPAAGDAPQSVGLSTTSCYAGDLVAAWAVSSNASRDGYAVGREWDKWNVSGEVWSSKSHGIYVDTTTPGVYEISRSGLKAGTLTVLTRPVGGTSRVTTAAGMKSVLSASTLKAGTVINVAAGDYTFTDAMWVRVPVTIRAEGRVKFTGAVKDAAAFNPDGTLTIEGVELGSGLFGIRTDQRLILKDCTVTGVVQNSPRSGVGGNGPIGSLTAIRCTVKRGGGFGVSSGLFSECVFSNTQNFPHNVVVNGTTSGTAFHGCKFEGSARGMVINNTKSLIVDSCQFVRVDGDANGAENICIETGGPADGIAITNNVFHGNAGPGVLWFALDKSKCGNSLVAFNRFLGSSVGVHVWGVSAESQVNNVAIFKNYLENGRSIVLVTGNAYNVRGAENIIANQTPTPDHNWNITPETLNPYPLSINDGVVFGSLLKSTTGGFKAEHIGCIWKDPTNANDWHIILNVIDGNTVQFSNWLPHGTSNIVVNIGSMQPAYCIPGQGNNVGVVAVRPFVKTIVSGDARVTVR